MQKNMSRSAVDHPLHSHLCYLLDALLASELFQVKPLNVSLGPLSTLAYCCAKKPLHSRVCHENPLGF